MLDLVTFYVPPYMGTAEALGLMRRMPSLRIVQTLTAGVDSVWADLPDGVALYNAAGVHDASTAELAVGLAIASLRHLDDFSRAQALGEWRHGRFDSLADKCVMILGYGHVGEAVDRRLAGFDVDVVRVARTARTSYLKRPWPLSRDQEKRPRSWDVDQHTLSYTSVRYSVVCDRARYV